MTGVNRGFYRYSYGFTYFFGKACFGLAGRARV